MCYLSVRKLTHQFPLWFLNTVLFHFRGFAQALTSPGMLFLQIFARVAFIQALAQTFPPNKILLMTLSKNAWPAWYSHTTILYPQNTNLSLKISNNCFDSLHIVSLCLKDSSLSGLEEQALSVPLTL